MRGTRVTWGPTPPLAWGNVRWAESRSMPRERVRVRGMRCVHGRKASRNASDDVPSCRRSRLAAIEQGREGQYAKLAARRKVGRVVCGNCRYGQKARAAVDANQSDRVDWWTSPLRGAGGCAWRLASRRRVGVTSDRRSDKGGDRAWRVWATRVAAMWGRCGDVIRDEVRSRAVGRVVRFCAVACSAGRGCRGCAADAAKGG